MLTAAEYALEQGLRSVDLERFYRKIDQLDDVDACWPWAGSRMAGGYGLWYVAARGDYPRRTYRAHRLVLVLDVGPLGSLMALHRCDFPPCCNRRHLYAGTAADNARDVVERGRHWTATRPHTVPRGASHWTRQPGALDRYLRGDSHPNAALTDQQVAQIRQRYAVGGVSQYQLAREYGVAQPTISAIIVRRNRAHNV